MLGDQDSSRIICESGLLAEGWRLLNSAMSRPPYSGVLGKKTGDALVAAYHFGNEAVVLAYSSLVGGDAYTA